MDQALDLNLDWAEAPESSSEVQFSCCDQERSQDHYGDSNISPFNSVVQSRIWLSGFLSLHILDLEILCNSRPGQWVMTTNSPIHSLSPPMNLRAVSLFLTHLTAFTKRDYLEKFLNI